MFFWCVSLYSLRFLAFLVLYSTHNDFGVLSHYVQRQPDKIRGICWGWEWCTSLLACSSIIKNEGKWLCWWSAGCLSMGPWAWILSSHVKAYGQWKVSVTPVLTRMVEQKTRCLEFNGKMGYPKWWGPSSVADPATEIKVVGKRPGIFLGIHEKAHVRTHTWAHEQTHITPYSHTNLKISGSKIIKIFWILYFY